MLSDQPFFCLKTLLLCVVVIAALTIILRASILRSCGALLSVMNTLSGQCVAPVNTLCNLSCTVHLLSAMIYLIFGFTSKRQHQSSLRSGISATVLGL